MKKKFRLTEEQIEIIGYLAEAPDLKKTPHYVAGKMGGSYYSTYHKIRSLEAIGVLTLVKSETGKMSYIPKLNILEAIKRIEIKKEKKEAKK